MVLFDALGIRMSCCFTYTSHTPGQRHLSSNYRWVWTHTEVFGPLWSSSMWIALKITGYNTWKKWVATYSTCVFDWSPSARLNMMTPSSMANSHRWCPLPYLCIWPSAILVKPSLRIKVRRRENCTPCIIFKSFKCSARVRGMEWTLFAASLSDVSFYHG